MKLIYTKQKIDEIKNNIYFSDEEEKVFDLWLRDTSVVETSMKLNISTATVIRRRKSILNKINLIKIV